MYGLPDLLGTTTAVRYHLYQVLTQLPSFICNAGTALDLDRKWLLAAQALQRELALAGSLAGCIWEREAVRLLTPRAGRLIDTPRRRR